MTRTSISLPTSLHERLERASKRCRRTKQTIALACLKRYLLKKTTRIHKQGTVAYNQKRCRIKLYFRLTEKEHNYVQAMRLTAKTSVSFLVSKAIERMLQVIEAMLTERADAFKSRFSSYRSLKFANNRVVGISLTLIRADSG